MFSRLKGVLESHIDSQILQEQARTRNLPSRRSGSPTQRPNSRARTTATGREKDPSEFENESDGSSVTTLIPSRVGTPIQGEAVTEDPLGAVGGKSEPSGKENERSFAGGAGEAGGSGSGNGEKRDVPSKSASPAPGPSSSSSSSSNMDLPTDVRVKLRKLEKIEGKHNDLLRSYKIVHARNALIEPFEKALRENTPFESIADPKPLIDYINSFALRADLAREELIRVSKERDEHKSQIQKLKDEQKAKDEEIEKMKKEMEVSNGTAESSTSKKQQEKSSDDIFSFDDEHDKLQTLVEQQQKEIETLGTDLDSAKAAQKAAEEAVEGMQQSVENAQKDLETTRELASAREKETAEIAEIAEKTKKDLQEMEKEKALTEENLKLAESRFKVAEVKARVGAEELEETTMTLDKKTKELEGKKKDLKEKEAGLTQAKRALEISKQKISDLEATNNKNNDMLKHLGKLTEELNQLRDGKILLQRAVVNLEGKLHESERRLAENSSKPTGEVPPASKDSEPSAAGATPSVGKNAKKNRKKKGKGKGGGAQGSTSTPDEGPVKDSEIVDEEPEPAPVPETNLWSESIIEDLQNQLVALRSQLDEKDSEVAKFNSGLQWRLEEKEEEIIRLKAKLVDVEAVHEEIESLRDDLVTLGQDHTEARNKIKDQAKELHEIRTRKEELEQKAQKLESEISDLRSQNSSTSAELEKAHAALIAEHESLKQKSSALQTDLSAAQKLAATRYKDTMELRAVIEKAQLELTSLRAEVATLTAGKNEANQKLVELKRLERSERDLKGDITNLNKKISDKEAELEKMRGKVREEAARRVQAEEATRRTQKDLRKLDDERKEALETADKNARDHARVQEEVNALKPKIAALEKEIEVLKDQNITLTEELELKVAQYTSSQSLMGSMRDQTGELAMQMKEAVEKYESMEEELTEAHKLLSERSREAETMRRLLSEVEDRNEARTRDMKERMEAAFDERDKAEEEAATIGRRRAREIEELRDRVRESERNLKHAEESQAAAERELNGLKDGKFRAEEALERIKREYEETKRAMASMQDALDQTDNQMEEIERQRAEMRKTLQEEQARSEKLQKSYKALQEEYRQLQTIRPKGIENNTRASIDSARSGRASPTSPRATTAGNQMVNMDYLKNVLLQFLEQKDKKTQLQLVPVLGMLLKFDKKDEQKWLAVVSAK